MDSKKDGPFKPVRPFRLWQGKLYAKLAGRAMVTSTGRIPSARIVTPEGDRVLVIPLYPEIGYCRVHAVYEAVHWAWCNYDLGKMGYVCTRARGLLEYGCSTPEARWS